MTSLWRTSEQIVHQWIEQKEYKLGNIMNAWLPDTGRRGQGTGYVRYLCIMGKEETIQRMRRAIEILG